MKPLIKDIGAGALPLSVFLAVHWTLGIQLPAASIVVGLLITVAGFVFLRTTK